MTGLSASRSTQAARRKPPPAAAQWAGEVMVVYLALIGVTAFLKWSLLEAVFAGELSTALGTAGGSWLHSALVVLRVLAPDARQLLLAAFAIFVVGRITPRIPLRWIVVLALALIGLVGGLNWLAYRELGQPLSRDVLWLAVTWVAGHPQSLSSIVRRPRVIVALAVLVVSCIVLVTLLARMKRRTIPVGSRFAPAAICLIWLPAAWYVTTRGGAPDSIAVRPYWTTTFFSLWGESVADPYGKPPANFADIRSEYLRAGFPDGAPLSTAQPHLARPVRYVVVIVMETAPARFYRLADNPRFPVFAKMSREGIVADRHYSTMPYTAEAIYSIATGMYPMHRIYRIYRIASRSTSRSSLAATLRDRRFETTFIDSFDIDWSPGNRMGDMWRGLGFQTLETGRSPRRRGVRTASPEATSFQIVERSIDSARAHGKGAFVTLATALGHFPWTPDGSATPATSATAMESTAASIDTLTGLLLAKLGRNGILDQSLVIVTGDHGLRFREEFASLGLEPPDMELTFNVPFILYAPGAITAPRRIRYPTSHVDIAPTILDATGVAGDSLLLHGVSLLRGEPTNRVLFALATGLSPADYVIRGEERYTVNHLTGSVRRQRLPGTDTTFAFTPDSAGRLLAAAERAIARSTAFQIGGIRAGRQ